MKIETFIREHLERRLAIHRALVIYGPQGLYLDSVPNPTGGWCMEKSRCLLGRTAVAESVLAFGKSGVAPEIRPYLEIQL